MVRKKVPEWLNSTMWSTPPPPSSLDDDPLLRNSHSTKMSSMKKEEDTISVTPPPSTAASSVQSPSARPRNNGSSSISSEYGNSSVVPPSSAEDFSRQAHLSAEVKCKTFIFNHKILYYHRFLKLWVFFFFFNWLVIEEGDQYEGTEESCFTKFAWFSWHPLYCLEGLMRALYYLWFCMLKNLYLCIIFVAAFAWLLATWTFTLVIWIETKEIPIQALQRWASN